MSKTIANLLDEIQVKGNMTLEEIGLRIKRSRPYLSTEKSSKKENKKLEALLREHFKDILQNNTKEHDNNIDFLIKKVLKIEAYQRTTVLALAEILSYQRAESVIKVLGELTNEMDSKRD